MPIYELLTKKIGFKKQKKLALNKLLNNALGFIKHEISKNLSLKVVPQIEFLADDSLEYSERLEELFSKIKEKEK